ncbi:hypothetical protein GCM10027596_36570 [Nocardioides korecus]
METSCDTPFVSGADSVRARPHRCLQWAGAWIRRLLHGSGVVNMRFDGNHETPPTTKPQVATRQVARCGEWGSAWPWTPGTRTPRPPEMSVRAWAP